MLRSSKKCNLQSCALKIMPLGLNKIFGNSMCKSGQSLEKRQMEQSAENLGDRNNCSLEGEKGQEASLFIFTKFGEHSLPQLPPQDQTSSKWESRGVCQHWGQGPTDPVACFLSFAPLGFQDDNSTRASVPPVPSLSIPIHL